MRFQLARTSSVAIFALLAISAYAGCSDYPDVVLNQLAGYTGAAAAGGEGGGAASSNGGGAAASGTGGSVVLDSGSDDSDGTGGPIDPDAGCASDVLSGNLKAANLLFVIDQSGSMNCNLPEDGQTTAECDTTPTKEDASLPSKWELTETALQDAFDALEQGGTPVSVGVTMFPIAGTLCDVKSTPDVAIDALDSHHNSEVDTFLGTVSPNGNTPLAGATILSYGHIYEQLQAGNLPGNTFVVLLTDGYETCADQYLDILLNDDAPEAYEQLGIRTFVIGAPGSEDARTYLSELAEAGGTPSSSDCAHDGSPGGDNYCHFDMTQSEDFAGDLATALDEISGTVLTCELDVPTNPTGGGVDLNEVNVEVNGERRFPTDCSVQGNSGWEYSDDNTLIILCGDACDAAQEENATVSIVIGCPTDQPE